MTGRTTLALAAEHVQAAVRSTDRGPVDPVALLLALHDATSTAELAAARLAAISAIGAVGGHVWPAESDGCPVTDGQDALALGCLVGRADDDEPQVPAGPLVHLAHPPIEFYARISRLTARAEGRLDGTDSIARRTA